MAFSDPTALPIVEELAAANTADCRGVLNVLLACEQPVAIHLGLMGLSPPTFSAWFATYDRDLARFSPGIMMWILLAEAAANRGVERIDLGYGEGSYKFRLANDSYPLARGVVWSTRIENVSRKIYRRLIYDPFLRDRMSTLPSWARSHLLDLDE